MVLSEEEKANRPFTLEETAEYLKVDPRTITRWISSGKLKAAKIGREWRIPKSEIERLLKID